jgi:hypothetical protein
MIKKLRGFSMYASKIIYDMEVIYAYFFDPISSYKDYLCFKHDPPNNTLPTTFSSWAEVKRWMHDYDQEYGYSTREKTEMRKNGGSIL